MTRPRSPLKVKALLNNARSFVKLAISCKRPGKRYFPASSPADTNSLDIGVGSGVVSY